MEWVPTLRVEVVNFATPALTAPVPIVVAPSLNVTVPAPGVPDVFDFTVAVNVTVAPNAAGFFDETTVVEVPALFTVWVSTADVLVVYGEEAL
jgi:hypothetical protein